MLDTETPRAASGPAPTETIWQRTDLESRRRIASFGTRLAMMLGMLALIALPGRRSFAEMAQLLQMVMAFGAMWTGLFAWAARQPARPGTLTLWDEALGFAALFLLVRVARTLVLGA